MMNLSGHFGWSDISHFLWDYYFDGFASGADSSSFCEGLNSFNAEKSDMCIENGSACCEINSHLDKCRSKYDFII